MKIQAAVLLLSAGLPLHAADACDPVVAATAKILDVPVHIYVADTAAFRKNQPKTGEQIYAGGSSGAARVK
jgi:hypothetical protein